ncbi:peptidase M75 family protein [soil metagenome]
MSAIDRAAVATLAAFALAGLAACSSDSDGSGTAASATGGGGAAQVAVTMVGGESGDQCQLSTDTVAAGPVTFTVVNSSATAITEFELLDGNRIIGEKENLVPGLGEVTLTLTLGGGAYEVFCPNASTEKVAFTVTGEASAEPTGTAAELLQSGADDYAVYVDEQVTAMVTGVQNLQKAVDSGDLAAAQSAYAAARPFYEKIETDVEGFLLPGADPTSNKGNLDYLIDMRASSFDPEVGWSGFHAVERDLFAKEKITDQTKRYAADLVDNVITLVDVAGTLTFAPEDLANGAAGLLEEVQTGKITGEEEMYSRLDLVDFAYNVEGAQQAFEALRPGLTEVDPDLVDTISSRFEDLNALLETYKDSDSLGGYIAYTPQVRASEGPTLASGVQALQESMTRLAEKVATA